MGVSLSNLNNTLSGLSSSISSNIGERVDPKYWQAAFSNRRQLGRAIGEEIGSSVAISPGLRPKLRYSFDRPPVILSRIDGERVYKEFPKYLGEEIPEGIRRGIQGLENDNYIFNSDFERWPVYDDLDPDKSKIQPLEEIITADYPLAVTSILETIMEGRYTREEIIKKLTREIAPEKYQSLVSRSLNIFNMVTPDAPEDGLGRIGQIQNLLQERSEENKEYIKEDLKSFNLDSFFTNFGIFDGFLNELTSTLSDFTSFFDNIQDQLNNIIPDISGYFIDDLIRIIDPNINETLQEALGINNISDDLLGQILSPILNNDIQSAVDLIKDFPSGLTDVGQITVLLEGLDLDPNNIIGGNITNTGILEILGDIEDWSGSNTPSSYKFNYVDTAEEFEADISSSIRSLERSVIHFIPNSRSAEDLHSLHSSGGFDGLQYHYIIDRSGRVQRGRPVSSAGISGENSVDIAFVTDKNKINGLLDELTNVIQQVTYKDIMAAFFRVVPGGDVELATGESESYPGVYPRKKPISTTMNPGVISNCVHGRGAGLTQTPGGINGTDSPIQPNTAGGGQLTGKLTNVDNRLVQVFESSLSENGLRGVVFSGYRPIVNGSTDTAGSTSGRHQGFAIDVNLYKGDVMLSLNVTEHLELIQDFTKSFVNNCVSSGYTPGVGMMSSTSNYMGPSGFHYDIARTLETGARANLGGGTNYWVGPIWPWVIEIFNEAGISAQGRVNGPSGGVSMSTLMQHSGGKLAS